MKPIHKMTTQDITELVKRVDKKLWVYIGVGSVLFVLFMWFICWPAWFKRVEIERESKLLEGKLITVETLKRRKPDMVKDKEHYQQLIKGVKEKLFGPGETAFLLGAISRLAEINDISIIASRPKEYDSKFPSPFDKQYEGSLFEFTVEGNYHQMGHFISSIEANPKVLRIQSFDLKPPIRDESEYTTIASMALSAVSLKEKKQ